jgi:hypothetical protein
MLQFFNGLPDNGRVLICDEARRTELHQCLSDHGDIVAADACLPLTVRSWQDVQTDDRGLWPVALPDLLRRVLSYERLTGGSATCVWVDVECSKGSMKGKFKRAGWDDAFLTSLLAQFGGRHMR